MHKNNQYWYALETALSIILRLVTAQIRPNCRFLIIDSNFMADNTQFFVFYLRETAIFENFHHTRLLAFDFKPQHNR